MAHACISVATLAVCIELNTLGRVAELPERAADRQERGGGPGMPATVAARRTVCVCACDGGGGGGECGMLNIVSDGRMAFVCIEHNVIQNIYAAAAAARVFA